MRTAIVTAFLSILVASRVHAQTGRNEQPGLRNEDTVLQRQLENADKFDVDLFSPHSPALIALGVAPQNVVDAGVFQDFDYDLANVGDIDKLSFGFGLSVSPYWLGTRNQTLAEYRTTTSRWERIWARTQVSFGAARAGTNNFEAVTLGLGMQSQLLDAQDHKFDEESFSCIHQAFETHRRPAHEQTAETLAGAVAEAIEGGDDGDIDIDLESLQEQTLAGFSDKAFNAAHLQCRDDAAVRLLTKPSWKVGLGMGMRVDEDDWSAFDFDGVSAWTSYRQPLDRQGRYAVFGFVRGDVQKVFDMENDLRGEANAVMAGAGLAYQRPWLRIDSSISFNYRDFEQTGLGTDEFVRYAGVIDVRLREGIWLEAGGGTYMSSAYLDGAFYSLNLRVAWGDYLSKL